MIYLSLFFLSVGAAILYLWTFVVQRRISQDTQWSLRALKLLRMLTENVQKHRGMSSAYLNGNPALKPDILKVQQTVGELLVDFELLLKEGTKSSHRQSEEKIKTDWQFIQSQALTRDVNESFLLHSNLAQILLNKMESIAAIANFESKDGHNGQLCTLLTLTLPQLTEALGQARSVGTGILTRKSSDPASEIQIQYLCRCIERAQSKLNQVRSTSEINDSIQKISQDLKSFMHQIENDLINAHSIIAKPDSYYKNCTKVIESTFVLFDDLARILTAQLDNNLGSDRKAYYRRQAIAGAVGISSIVGITSTG